MGKHCKYLAACLGFAAGIFSACGTIQDVTGSFEESASSGRIGMSVPDDAGYRFFRFHLRQFENDIGGVFETFDLNSYDDFNQVPMLMTNGYGYYYCARIDFSYVRDNKVFINFTDREQRRWRFASQLGAQSLDGQLTRLRFDGKAVSTHDLEYLLDEDAAYRKLNPKGEGQIVLDKLLKTTDKHLDCIYYHRKKELDVVLPNALQLHQCLPSPKQCRSIRMALVGMPVLRKVDVAAQSMQIVQTAYLDDCDLSGGRMRRFVLRDNPYTIDNMLPDMLFVATIVAFEDTNMDGNWDYASEPILAALDGQSLAFYEMAPPAIYGKNIDGITYDTPVLNPDEIDEKGGWFLYNDTSDKTGTAWRTIKKLELEQSERIYLTAVNADGAHAQKGCYVWPTSDDQTPCRDLLPVFVQ